jgi:hypothetical protein
VEKVPEFIHGGCGSYEVLSMPILILVQKKKWHSIDFNINNFKTLHLHQYFAL